MNSGRWKSLIPMDSYQIAFVELHCCAYHNLMDILNCILSQLFKEISMFRKGEHVRTFDSTSSLRVGHGLNHYGHHQAL